MTELLKVTKSKTGEFNPYIIFVALILTAAFLCAVLAYFDKEESPEPGPVVKWKSASRVIPAGYARAIELQSGGAGHDIRSASDLIDLILLGRAFDRLAEYTGREIAKNTINQLRESGRIRIVPIPAGPVAGATDGK